MVDSYCIVLYNIVKHCSPIWLSGLLYFRVGAKITSSSEVTRLGDRQIALLLLETTHQLHQQCFRLEFDYKYTINCIRINVNVANSK